MIRKQKGPNARLGSDRTSSRCCCRMGKFSTQLEHYAGSSSALWSRVPARRYLPTAKRRLFPEQWMISDVTTRAGPSRTGARQCQCLITDVHETGGEERQRHPHLQVGSFFPLSNPKNVFSLDMLSRPDWVSRSFELNLQMHTPWLNLGTAHA